MDSYEKKYNEALERARELRDKALAYNANHYVKDYETIFPELRESEDEKIRKWLIQYIKDTHPIANYWNGAPTISDVLSWLEKQKEQKLVEDKYQQELEATDRWQEGYEAGYNAASRPAWSEEDEKMLEEIINHIYTTSVQRIPARPGSDIGKSWIKFLKFLRPHWKPSDEQMEALYNVFYTCSVGAKYRDILAELYEQLKKLM